MINTDYNTAKYAKAQNSYHDFKGLTELKEGARADDPEALREVARQFEALFIQMILKSAREADELIGGEESLLRSKEMSFFQDMLDEQFSLAISNSGSGKGLGLADVLVRQLSKEINQPLSAEVAAEARQNAQALEDDFMAKLNLRRLKTSQQQIVAKEKPAVVPPLLAAQNPVADTDKTKAEAATNKHQPQPNPNIFAQPIQVKPTAQLDKKAYFNSPQEFVQHIYPLAREAGEKLGLDPKVLVAQTALETGWGKYMVSKQDGSSSFNLFNIKADQRWKGSAAEVSTLEYRNGQAKQERWPFRAYSSLEESMQDYINFLRSNPRYDQALKTTHNSQAYIQNLQQAGYATDPNYAKKIINIMHSSRLSEAMQGIEQSAIE